MPSGVGDVISTVVLCLLLALITIGPFVAGRLSRAVRRRLEARRERQEAARPVVHDVGKYVDRLRRLSRELAELTDGTPWARQHGTRMAYDGTLISLCTALDIPNTLADTPTGWAKDMERLRMEDVVYAKGLRIHPVGT